MIQEQIITTARSYIGTPWKHGGRVKDIGIDCTGLIFNSFNENGCKVNDIVSYSLFDNFNDLVRELNRQCNRVPDAIEDIKLLQPADILLFRAEDMYNHVAFYSGDRTIIHACSYPAIMRVLEEKLTAFWHYRLKGVYRYKGF